MGKGERRKIFIVSCSLRFDLNHMIETEVEVL